MSESPTNITWSIGTRKVEDLKHWGKNPRRISPEKTAMLKERIVARGFHDVIKIDQNNVILSGNHRKDVLLELGIEEVNVLIPDRELTADEIEKVVLESNMHDGEFDIKKLAEFDKDILEIVGFNDLQLQNIFQDKSVDKLFKDGVQTTPEEKHFVCPNCQAKYKI